MSTIIASGRPAAQFGGPPASRMAGRPSRNALQAKATKPKISAAPGERANQFLDGEADIDQAIHQGIISANMASHFRSLMKADPTDTRKYLEKLGMHRASAPTESVSEQVAASASEAYPTGALSVAERSRIAEARDGGQSTRIVHGGL